MLNAFRIGHMQDEGVGTGVTVILAPGGAVGGVAVLGNAPATRETDLLRSECTVDKVNAVVLSGGSAFGLEAACGVMEYLKKRGFGYPAGAYQVPIVVGASLYDLEYKTFGYPDKEMGKMACEAAGDFCELGASIGAGCGATVGKLRGAAHAAKCGLGVATIKIGAVEMAAVVAVNAFGNVYSPEMGEMLCGMMQNGKPVDIEKMLRYGVEGIAGMNTTIGCVVTNAKLTKAQCNVLAKTVHDAYARCIHPVHTMVDGDAVFVMASGEVECNLLAMQSECTKLMMRAIVNAAKRADDLV